MGKRTRRRSKPREKRAVYQDRIKRAKQAIGRAGAKRGYDNEEKFLRAYEEVDLLPSFIVGKPCRATPYQDKHQGIDIIVPTDVGKVFLNVKSSNRGAEEFVKHQKRLRRRKPVYAVVVRDDDTLEDVRRRATKVVKRARADICARRRK